MLLFCFVKDFFIQDINAGLTDETEIPEQLVSTLTIFDFTECLQVFHVVNKPHFHFAWNRSALSA